MLHSKISDQTVILIVKSSLALSIALPLLAAGVFSLSGCGQPGPLYLPKLPPRPASASVRTPGTADAPAVPNLPNAPAPDVVLPQPAPTSPVLPQ
jgi:predicted small lipoprotein YifL